MNQTSPDNWTIRKARIGDAGALARCMSAAFAGPSAKLGGDPLPPILADYETEIRDYPVWIAEMGGDIIGGLVLDPKPDHILIGIVAVVPKAQGLGLGKALLNFAENYAKQTECPELRLATHIALDDNVRLYTRLGWVEMKRDDNRIYMSKLVGL